MRLISNERLIRLASGVILIIVLCAAATWAVNKVTIPSPETISLTDYARTTDPVTFTHKDHGAGGSEKPACAVCHHTTAWDQTPGKCSACHKPFEESAVPADIVAFHKLCIGCHKTQIEQGNQTLTLACDSCHTRKE
jgi:hypothetical protein